MTTTNESARADVEAFLDEYADALVSTDLPRIAACYGYPGLVLLDQGAIPVAAPPDVESAFAVAAESYHAQGLVHARPAVQGLDRITEKIVSVDVRWDYLDAEGVARRSESYRYVLRSRDGSFAIHVVIPTGTG